MSSNLSDDKIEELISALQDLQGQQWGKKDYTVSRELYKMLERLMVLEEKYRVGGRDEQHQEED